MTWHLEFTGKRIAVNAAIDAQAAIPNGMPPTVAAYLKEVVGQCFSTGTTELDYTIYVKSTGARPMQASGALEICEVKVVHTAPYKKAA